MSHVNFDEYDLKPHDIIYLPPEVLKSNGTSSKFALNSNMDVWTLGMILLHCMCLTYFPDDNEVITFDKIFALLKKTSGPSLINTE